MPTQTLFKTIGSLAVVWAAATSFAQAPQDSIVWREAVGLTGSNRVVLPVNQMITPAGKQIELRQMRPQVLALSPDGQLLVTSGKTHDLVAIDPATDSVTQKVPLPDDGPLAPLPVGVAPHYPAPNPDEQVSYTGLVFSPDGSRIYLSNVHGSIKVFAVDAGHKITGLGSIALPPANQPRRREEIPAGLAVSADGRHLYVVGSLSNQLFDYDLPSGKLLRSFEVGAVPYTVVLAGHKAYVSNWAGRRPVPGSVTGPAGQGTLVRVDAKGVASEGSVSVIDLDTGRNVAEILTGLHASALVLSPDGRFVCVANANSDTVSVIATATDQVVETIPVRWQAQDLFGASPNALAMNASGDTLYVCDGTQNAVAVIAFHPLASGWGGRLGLGRPAGSKLQGMIPAGWFPGAMVFDAPRRRLWVANIKGTLPGPNYFPGRHGYNSHEHDGTISDISLPGPDTLKTDTLAVLRDYRRAVEASVFLPARPDAAPSPVPERLGEPCVFQHVIYFIKENRTYDSVLGDVAEGDGDPALCTFPARVAPNQHKIVHEFVLMDRFYCCGILSADGHEWADTALASDYMEKSFADFPRSYPDLQDVDDFDAVAYSPAGFVWDDALAHGKTFRCYGEGTIATKRWSDPANHKPVTFLDSYRDFARHTGLITYSNYAGIASLQPYIMTNNVGWDLGIPDVYRAAQFLREFREFVARGNLPNLIIMDLPNDHTSGTDPGMPTPAAQVADNDLAFGQILDAVSHSPYWRNTCIFACEDDPQSGWDHQSGYRTTAYVASAYTKRRAVVSLNYNQNSILRTIELMLGLPPMNQLDATATPMTECFTGQPDFTPYQCLTNNIPLDEMNPDTARIHNRQQLRDAVVSARLPLGKPDQCPDDVLNRIIWHAQMGFTNAYPQWAVAAGDQD